MLGAWQAKPASKPATLQGGRHKHCDCRFHPTALLALHVTVAFSCSSYKGQAASHPPEAMATSHRPPHRRRHAYFKPIVKRRQPGKSHTFSTKTLHHNYLAYDFTGPPPNHPPTARTPAHRQATTRNRATQTPPPQPPSQPQVNHPADTRSTLRGFATCTAIVAWSIHEQAITKALLTGPTQLFELAKRAWTVPAFPSICFAVLYVAALWATFGATTTAQFIRGCATEA